MKNLFVIVLLFITGSVWAQPPLVYYEKLSPEKVEEAFKLESSEHVLGRVVQYLYWPSGKLLKETGYENKKGKLAFMFEYGYEYNDKNRLIHKYKYTEIPSEKHAERNDTWYSYPSDSLTIVEVKRSDRVDSTLTYISKDAAGRVVLKLDTVKFYSGWRSRIESSITQFAYNDKGKLVQRLETEKGSRGYSKLNYEYDKKGRITKKSRSSNSYQELTIYKKGRPLQMESQHTSSASKRKYLYSYDRKGREILSKLYEDGKHTYSYVSSYNEKGQRIRYDMINEVKGTSGVWLYEYDESGKLIYKIDLYARN